MEKIDGLKLDASPIITLEEANGKNNVLNLKCRSQGYEKNKVNDVSLEKYLKKV